VHDVGAATGSELSAGNEFAMPKRLLFLGYDQNQTRLLDVIKGQGWTVVHKSSLETDLSDQDLVISFGYTHKLTNDTLHPLFPR